MKVICCPNLTQGQFILKMTEREKIMKKTKYEEKNAETFKNIIEENANEIQMLHEKLCNIEQKLNMLEHEIHNLMEEREIIKNQIAEKNRYIQYSKILLETVISDKKEEQ